MGYSSNTKSSCARPTVKLKSNWNIILPLFFNKDEGNIILLNIEFKEEKVQTINIKKIKKNEKQWEP